MTCREVTRLLSETQERDPTLGESISLRIHTTMCSGCRNFGKQMRTLRCLMRSYAEGEGEGPPDP